MTSTRPVSIRELHQRTGRLVREAAVAVYAAVVTDRGRPVATLAPYAEPDKRVRFRDRVLLPAFDALTKRFVGDSGTGIRDDRDRF